MMQIKLRKEDRILLLFSTRDSLLPGNERDQCHAC